MTAMMTANSAVHSWAERALFRLRKFAAAGWRQLLANAEVLAPLSPTRLRSRLKPLGRPIRTYDGTCVPACQRQRTNWLHGLPAMSDLCIESAFHRSHRRKGQRWPNRHFSPLGATFPSGGPGEPKNRSVRSRQPSLRPDGAWTVPRSAGTDSPGQERG